MTASLEHQRSHQRLSARFRAMIVVAGAAMIVVATAGTARAKLPPLEVRVSDVAPAPGQPVDVEVRIRTEVGTWTRGFIERTPPWMPRVDLWEAESVTPTGLVGEPLDEVVFTAHGDGTYTGTLTVGQPGEYRLVVFGALEDGSGLPTPLALTVGGPALPEERPAVGHPSTDDDDPPVSLIIAGTATLLLTAGAGRMFRSACQIRSR